MINYTPFLKLKGSEISALIDLIDKPKSLIPFFDFPKKELKKTRQAGTEIKNKEQMFISDNARCSSRMSKKLKWIESFYLDNFDLEDEVRPMNIYNYTHIINAFGPLGMIPVIGIDRCDEHVISVINGINQKVLSNKKVALRITRDDFISFNVVKTDILDLIDSVKDVFIGIDLIFDCRVVSHKDVAGLSSKIIDFIDKITKVLTFDKVIVTGSMIPASISSLIETNKEIDVVRPELSIFSLVYKEVSSKQTLFLGDYTCVSPEYSDVDMFVEDMSNVTTAKVMYPYANRLFIKRGGRVKSDKGQYTDFADLIVNNKHFYRSKTYSWGDKFLFEKANNIGSNTTPSTIVKPLISLHLTYMLNV